MDWISYFLGSAFQAAQKSKDAETRHGCVISDKYNRPIGFGYNSFARGMPDHLLPNSRPDKYPWMIHAEKNAVGNCTVDPRSCGAMAYVTGRPCFDCAYYLWQVGIEKVYYADRADWTWHAGEEERERFVILEKYIELIPYKPDLSYLTNVLKIAQDNDWL